MMSSDLVIQNLAKFKEFLDTEKDAEFRGNAKAEISTSSGPRKLNWEEELKQLLIPKDPNDF